MNYCFKIVFYNHNRKYFCTLCRIMISFAPIVIETLEQFTMSNVFNAAARFYNKPFKAKIMLSRTTLLMSLQLQLTCICFYEVCTQSVQSNLMFAVHLLLPMSWLVLWIRSHLQYFYWSPICT